MRLALVPLVVLVASCGVQVGSQVSILVEVDGSPDERAAFVARVLTRLQGGELEAAIRSAVPNVSDAEVASLKVYRSYRADTSGQAGLAITCWIDIYDQRASAAVNGCIQGIQNAIAAEQAVPPAAQQGAAADTKQLAASGAWWHSGGGGLAAALAVSAVWCS